MSKRVAVLMGGWSGEREVSLMSGKCVMDALKELGHTPIAVDLTRDLSSLISQLTPKPDVVFNALHGKGGEDGVVQSVLEFLQIPYTHSNVLASALGMDKLISRELFRTAHLLVPPTVYLSKRVFLQNPPFSYPFVVKPRCEGSSIGLEVVRNDQDYERVCKTWPYEDNKVLVERFIQGRELTVAVLNGKALGVLEIKTKNAQHDYDSKYTPGRAEHIVPAPMPEEAYQQALNIAEHAHRVLGCRGLTRSDFIYVEENGEHKFYLLEINTQPGFTNISVAPEIAQSIGISFSQLVNEIINEAQCEP